MKPPGRELITRVLFVFSTTGQIGTVDYIAIGTSLGLAVLILTVLGYFFWRAQKRSNTGANKEVGQVSGVNLGPMMALGCFYYYYYHHHYIIGNNYYYYYYHHHYHHHHYNCLVQPLKYTKLVNLVLV